MIHFEIPKNQSSIIKVIGVGGGGSNAVNYMHGLGIDKVDFVVCNTDIQALALSPVANKIQLGPHLTQGLGAGANPEIGKQASEESLEDISKILKVNTRMAFITAGMGGGTGTGGAPVVSKICKDLGILTVGIVTLPFSYEGKRRMKQAEEGIERMRENVDTILVISNDKVRQQFGNLPFTKAFAKADDILATAAKCITDVINTTGQINVDFADVCTVMKNGGVAILGSAAVAGENRALDAVEQALNSPLLSDNDISGAKWILLNINSSQGEHEHTMDEMEAVQAYVQQMAGDECNVILGMGHDPNLNDRISVTVIATGFPHRDIVYESPAKNAKPENEKKVVVVLGQDIPAVETVRSESSYPTYPTATIQPNLNPYLADAYPWKTNMQESSPAEPTPDPLHISLTLHEPGIPEPPKAVAEPEAYNAPEEPEQEVPMFKLTIKDDAETEAMPYRPSERVITDDEAEERRQFEERKRALEMRAERLRAYSFNLSSTNDNRDDMESVPAYLRKNKKLDGVAGSKDNYYSGYHVGSNDPNDPNAIIQTKNTFLEGNIVD